MAISYVANKKLLFLSIIIVFVLSCAACSSSSNSSSQATPQAAKYYEEEKAYDSGADESALIASVEGSGEAYGASDADIADVEQKIIKSASIEMTIKDYDETVSEMRRITENADGYIESANTYNSSYNGKDYRNGSLVVRVPSDAYDRIKKELTALGKVISDNESAVNETQEYYDIQARLKTKQAEEKRLLEMIEKAAKIEDLILLEERLANVRGDIETYQSRMRNIDRLSSYSTISLYLSEQRDEVIEPVSDDLTSKMKNAFISSMNGIKSFFEALAIFFAGVIVPLLMIAVCAFAFFAIRKKSLRNIEHEQEIKKDVNEKDDNKKG